MKNVLILFTTFCLANAAYGQDITEPDSTLAEHLFTKYVTRCFDDLAPIDYLLSHPLTKEGNLCSLTILTYLEVYDQDSLFNEAIFTRLRQMAQEFYNDGTPLILYGYGRNSTELSENQNKEGNPYGITYVSMGNSCISFGSFNTGVKEFNSETLRLVNYIKPIAQK